MVKDESTVEMIPGEGEEGEGMKQAGKVRSEGDGKEVERSGDLAGYKGQGKIMKCKE